MGKRTTATMPTLEFGKLTLSVGKRGRVQLTGKGSFTPVEFSRFLDQGKWFLQELNAARQVNGVVLADAPTLSESIEHL